MFPRLWWNFPRPLRFESCYNKIMTSQTPIKARDTEHLIVLIKNHIDLHGNTCDLNHIDVSDVNDMSSLFAYTDFNGDISQWDVAHVQDMSFMFNRSTFNGDISQWNTARVTDMRSMFEKSRFNGDISHWNTSKVKWMGSMFNESIFNQDISRWNTSKVNHMSMMFSSSRFNGDISNWDVSRAKNMSYMFANSCFEGDISRWNVSKVTDLSYMFSESLFNGDLSFWNLKALKLSGTTCVFSKIHDSPLGYLMILSNTCSFQNDDPRAAQFELLRAICDGLNMDPLSAAQYIYQAFHVPTPMVELSTAFAL